MKQKSTEIKNVDVLKKAKENIKKFRKNQNNFLFGCAMDLFFDERDETYLEKFKELFNYATTENILKWSVFEPEENKKRWEDADKIINWCLENNITIKGHALAWGHKSGMPKWLKKKSNEEIEKLQLNRIREIMQRYKGKIKYYEIVNEPTRALLFEDKFDNFTEKCMKVAAETDPNAKLIFNGNKLFLKDGGKEKFKDFLQDMISKGIKFDGVGIQAHRPITRRIPNKEMWDMIEYFSDLKKEIHITEFMVQDMDPKKQAEYYKDIYTICYGNPNVKAITTWGLSEDRNAIPKSGLLDKNLNEKPVYKTLKKFVKG